MRYKAGCQGILQAIQWNQGLKHSAIYSVTSFNANLGLMQLGMSSETSFSALINLF